MPPTPHLAFSPLTNTVYIVLGGQKYPVPEKELRAILKILDEGQNPKEEK
jgi:hypothetical protein